MSVSTTIMTMIMPFAYLILFIASLLIMVIVNSGRRSPALKLPRGPKAWPLIGSIHLVGPLPHRSFQTLSAQYGPLMHLRLGCRPVIVAGSVEMAKEILTTHDLRLADRIRTTAGKYTLYNHTDLVFSPYGPYWRQARRIYFTELFISKKLYSLESKSLRAEEVRTLVQKLFKDSGMRVRLKDHVFTMALNIVSLMAMGKKYIDGSTTIQQDFKRIVEEHFFLNGVFNYVDYMPWLAFFDIHGYERRLKKLQKELDQFLEHVLDDHVDQGEGIVDGDCMVDVLLRLADDPHLEVKLTRDNIKAFTLDIVAGGTETSSMTIEWALSELLRNKETLARATEEVEKMIGRDRWVEEEDITSGGLPYIESVVKETMRLHPSSPLLIPRLAREDCTINNYHVSAGTTVMINTWAIGRDPKLWETPEEFLPERFMGKEIDVKGKHFQLLPFGSGRRMCPGYNHGMIVVQLTIATLLQGFDWKLPEDIYDLSMDEVFGLSLTRKVPLEAMITPRLPSHMYL